MPQAGAARARMKFLSNLLGRVHRRGGSDEELERSAEEEIARNLWVRQPPLAGPVPGEGAG